MAGGVNTHDNGSSEAKAAVPRQLQAGLFPPEAPRANEDNSKQPPQPPREQTHAAKEQSDACKPAGGDLVEAAEGEGTRFSFEETVLILDWDDTVLPSTWVNRQGLRLDEGSQVSAWQRQQLAEVAEVAAKTIRIAKQYGTVVLVTNAERGWIELSCQKFMPTLVPSLENLKVVSARTTYESAECPAPVDWKIHAFDNETRRLYGWDTMVDPDQRKNMLSMGDGVHEREALLQVSSVLPNCRSKSLKFVERPDIAQISKQLSLVTSCFDRIVHHDGNLDLCIRCA
mmetsp:Transcript_12218/g.36298  ORF Transcript_12218/g.36298 Transcript_12218/m.36298 type:complete len:285 (+) Transcript_12218:66-920(+)